jgi:hypothetical protein
MFSRNSRSLSPHAPSSLPCEPARRRTGTHEPGRGFLAVATASRLDTPSVSHVLVLFPRTLGSPVDGRHARFEALLPPGVRSAATPPLARERPPVGALLGFSPFRAYSTTVPGSVSRVDARGRDKPCTSYASGHPAIAVAHRDPDTDAWAREPKIRRYAASIERRAPPSSGNPAQRAPHERPLRQSPARPARLVTVTRTERLARAPVRRHPAPPCPSLPAPPEEGASGWTSKTQSLEPSTDPAPCEAGRRTHSSRSTPSSPVARWTPSRLTFATRAGEPAPSRGAGPW